jgi:hypothetical protein
MNDLLEWGPARHRAPLDQPLHPVATSTPTRPGAVDQRDADRDRPDDN